MQLFRGSNNKEHTFKAYDGQINENMRDFGPGIYFFGFDNRKKAATYATTNPRSIMDDFDDETEEEFTETGYVHQCHVNGFDGTLLNELDTDLLDPYLDSMIIELLSTDNHSDDYLRDFAGSEEDYKIIPNPAYNDLKEHILEEDNIHEAIKCLYETMGSHNEKQFLSSISPLLKEIGSVVSYCSNNEGSSEYIVYDQESIVVNSATLVYRDDVEKASQAYKDGMAYQS